MRMPTIVILVARAGVKTEYRLMQRGRTPLYISEDRNEILDVAQEYCKALKGEANRIVIRGLTPTWAAKK